jgi:hypothetical protein
MYARTPAWTVYCEYERVEKINRSHILTDVDSEIQHVYEQDGKKHDTGLHASRLRIGTENTKRVSNDFLSPGQGHERYDCCCSASNDERSSLAPSQAAVVTLKADIGLHKDTRERTGDPNEGKHGLAETEGEEIGLRDALASLRKRTCRGDSDVGGVQHTLG